jgi:hypothetical protein
MCILSRFESDDGWMNLHAKAEKAITIGPMKLEWNCFGESSREYEVAGF